MKKVRALIYAVMLAACVPLWLLIVLLSYALTFAATLGKKIYPESKNFGNCWTYSLPLWREEGGSLLIEIHHIGKLRVPHAIWVRPDGATQETYPVDKAENAREAWYGLKTVYFKYRIIRRFKIVPRSRASKPKQDDSL